MGGIALYRKYRPTRFEDVVGQGHIIAALRGVVASGAPTHAYLFAGSRGTGKTSVARILARELGVRDRDLYEIDAASNRGIDDVRVLREEVHVLPAESPYKVYVVDECHMLTREAFNALLKTLEEPPQHVIFILATTEAEKLPETVASRCEVHTFRKPTVAELRSVATAAAEQEGYALELAAAELIALLGDGSYRDMYGALQRVLGASGAEAARQGGAKKLRHVSADSAAAVLGAPRGALLNDILGALAERDLSGALTALERASGEGADMRLFLTLLLGKLRAILLLRYARNLRGALQPMYSEEDFALLSRLAADPRANINSTVLREFLAAAEALRHAHIPTLPIELALVKLLDH
jgi:DNA polymerase-3 subunit gamma/tau